MLLTKLNYLQQSKQQCQMKVGLSFAILFFFFSWKHFHLESRETSQEGPECFRDFLQKSSLISKFQKICKNA